MKKSKLFVLGIIIVILSLLLPLLTTIYGILQAFDALANSENVGVGMISNAMENSKFSIGFSLIGLIIGIIFIIIGKYVSKKIS